MSKEALHARQFALRIPDDALMLANEAEAKFSGTNLEVIAQAILAERERCAKIAEWEGNFRDLSRIARLIRKGEA